MAKTYLVSPVAPAAAIPDPDRPGQTIPAYGTVLRESAQLSALIARGEVTAQEIDPAAPPSPLPAPDPDLDALALSRSGLTRAFTLGQLLGMISQFSVEDLEDKVAQYLSAPAGSYQTTIAGLGAAIGTKAPSTLALAGSSTILRPITEYLHGRIFDPRNYGAVARKRSGSSAAAVAADLERARLNQIAFQQAADDYTAALIAGEAAGYLFPPGKYLILGVKNEVGHWNGAANMPLTDGWSNACIVFDGQAVGDTSLFFGGVVHGADCTLIRMEEDPCSLDNDPDTAIKDKAFFNSYDSCIFVTRWFGMRHTGRVFVEGYGEAQRRLATSGAGWDLSRNVRHFSAEWIGGFAGTNSAITVGMNRGKNTFSEAGPEIGYDIGLPCYNIVIKEICAFNGEHGVLLNIVSGVHIGSLTIDTRSLVYKGVAQPRYMQRGIYILCADAVTIGVIDVVSGPEHVAVFIGLFPAARTAFNANVWIGRLIARATKNQNTDRHCAIGIYDNNDETSLAPGGIYRQFYLHVGDVSGYGWKRLLHLDSDRDAGGFLAEDRSPCRGLQIDTIDGAATAQGINLPLYGGSDGDIVIGRGAITVKSDPTYSATAKPGLGIRIVAEAALAIERAKQSPMTLGALLDEIEARGGNEPNPHVPGEARYVTNWPVTSGVTTPTVVLFDPYGTGKDIDDIEAWRPARAPKFLSGVTIGPRLKVTSGNRVVAIAGVEDLNLVGLVAVYADEGVPEADSREIALDAIRNPEIVRYRTGAGIAAKQDVQITYVPVPTRRSSARTSVIDLAPIAAGGMSSVVVRNVSGVKASDACEVIPLGINPGKCFINAWAPSDGVVNWQVHNLGATELDLPSIPYLIRAEGVMGPYTT